MKSAAADPRAAVLDRIKELPPLPLVVHELMRVMRDTECSNDQVNRILSSDQALASKILRLVNSSFYGLPGRVSTIPRAVVILGHAAVRNFAAGLAVVERLGSRLPASRRQNYWQHALATAAGAEVLARRVELPEPDEAFVAGLLHDIGHLILMLALPDEHATAAEGGLLGDVERERAAMGLDHCRAGRQLLQHWQLPSPLLESVRLHHATESCQGAGVSLLTVVALADRLSRVLDAPGEGPDSDDDLVDLAATLRLEPAAVLAEIPAIRARMAEARSFLQIADLGEAVRSASPTDPGATAVVVSGSPARAAWLAALSRHHGLAVRDLREWLLDPAGQPGSLVLWDGAAIEPAHADRLRPLLMSSGAQLRLVGKAANAGDPAGGGGRPVSLAFSAVELGLG
jgi:HD-like signal output (HDOD) protein